MRFQIRIVISKIIIPILNRYWVFGVRYSRKNKHENQNF